MQRQGIAALFKMDNAVVSRAIRILGVLDEASRRLVLGNLQKTVDNQAPSQKPDFESLKKTGTNWLISEKALFRLTDLGYPKTLKGGGLDLAERALRRPWSNK